MNPRRKQQKVTLLKKETTESPSGAIKEDWVKQERPISVSLYDQSVQNQLTLGPSGARVKQYDYLGMTSTKTLTADKYRISDGTKTYRLKGVNNEGRLAQLFLVVLENGE